ncbi:MAG: serine hydrolase domain-containing protein [Ardenticatenaceae bacterium]|nr:serine hydrolase domain-containing protein [Ardenticatenaceae bacterium]
MKKVVCFLVIMLLLLVACGGASDDADTVAAEPSEVEVVAAEPTVVEVVVEEVPTEPAATATALPTPTEEPEPTPARTLITSEEEMVGIWLGTVAGESGYLMYTADGRFLVALSQDALAAAPLVSGEYWFEDGQIYLRDLENVGHWTECDSETVGVYDVVDLGDNQVEFQIVDDGCNEGGFTRSYLFTNMKQKWVAEPVEAIAEVPAAETLPELAEALQSIADTWVSEIGAPGVILLVDAPDMNFKWQGAAGMAKPAEGDPLLPDDQFIISSMTKMMTGVTVMQLVENGDLTLDDPISLYLPAEMVTQLLVLDDNSYGAVITVRQLLNHTSGLGDFSNGEDTDGNGLSDFKDLVLNEPDIVWNETMVLEWAIANAPPVGQPGEIFNYSDTNYQLLGMIIESASGLALHDAYRQFIFEPLGMDHTYFEFREAPDLDARDVSHAYYQGTLWNEMDSHSYEWGSGGLVSTAGDMNMFLRVWVDGDLFEDPASKEAMMEWIDSSDAGAYYGLGFYRFVLDEWDIPGLGEMVGHGGLFNSQAFYWPEQNVIIVGTLNSNEPSLGFISMMIEVMFTVQEFSG